MQTTITLTKLEAEELEITLRSRIETIEEKPVDERREFARELKTLKGIYKKLAERTKAVFSNRYIGD